MNRKRYWAAAVLALAFGWCDNSWAIITGQYLFEGGSANDSSGFNRHGTTFGVPTFTAPGLYKTSTQSLVFTAGQSVELPPMTDFIRNAPGATLAAWVRSDGGSGTRTIMVVNNGDVASETGIGDARAIIQIFNNQYRALGRLADGGGSSSTVGYTPELSATYFVAGVFDYLGGGIRLYVDGYQVASTTVGAWNSNSADSANLVARIGSHATGNTETWIGAIDGARVFNTALTATDILNLYRTEALNPIILGDVNGDAFATAADLTPIRQNYLQTVAMRSQGDLTGDRFVDLSDFRQWKTALLSGGGSLEGLDLGFLGVPEPSTAWLAALGLGGICAIRRRRRRALGPAHEKNISAGRQ